MSKDAWMILGILLGMFALLIWNRISTWLIFMGTPTLGLAPAEDLLNGFANTGMHTVAALFPMAAGMYATGAITLLSNRFIGLTKTFGWPSLRFCRPRSSAAPFSTKPPWWR